MDHNSLAPVFQAAQELVSNLDQSTWPKRFIEGVLRNSGADRCALNWLNADGDWPLVVAAGNARLPQLSAICQTVHQHQSS